VTFKLRTDLIGRRNAYTMPQDELPLNCRTDLTISNILATLCICMAFMY